MQMRKEDPNKRTVHRLRHTGARLDEVALGWVKVLENVLRYVTQFPL